MIIVILHQGGHSAAYSQAVYLQLTAVENQYIGQPAVTANALRSELQRSATELVDGNFTWP
jgi:hypothetical protein